MDCLGDWREELITAVKGEIRIYTSPIPDDTQRPSLISDRQCRFGIVNQTMGYYYPAQVGLEYSF